MTKRKIGLLLALCMIAALFLNGCGRHLAPAEQTNATEDVSVMLPDDQVSISPADAENSLAGSWKLASIVSPDGMEQTWTEYAEEKELDPSAASSVVFDQGRIVMTRGGETVTEGTFQLAEGRVTVITENGTEDNYFEYDAINSSLVYVDTATGEHWVFARS